MPDWDPTIDVITSDHKIYVRKRQAKQDADMEELTQRLLHAVVGERGIHDASGAAGRDGNDVEEQLDTSGDRPWREYH
ncbi:hypothetical protein FRB94_003758 [Tulasnella sp. JGI-2019a]|nr:hypothetical protein FRB94_003758 [Tulasnella sp. JGI-2019a]KAG9031547.1 hypothetical protein FRB95_002541 [Tulasnella sp. JGI-2019a]